MTPKAIPQNTLFHGDHRPILRAAGLPSSIPLAQAEYEIWHNCLCQLSPVDEEEMLRNALIKIKQRILETECALLHLERERTQRRKPLSPLPGLG